MRLNWLSGVVAGWLCCVLGGATTWAEAPAEPYEVELSEDVEYGNAGGVKLVQHVARPKGLSGPLPGMVCIHGGGWIQGNRNDFREVVQMLASAGFVATTIEYRLAPEHKWPAQIEDSKCAVRWMRAHASQLGVDPNRIGVMGGSAGGHLSALVGMMEPDDGYEGDGGWADQSSQVQAVVNFFGPTDLVKEFEHQEKGKALAALVKQDVSILQQFLGGTPSDLPEVYKAASPMTYVSRNDPPMLILQGTHDVLVPYDQSLKLAAALARNGNKGRLELIFGAGHGWQGPELERTKGVVLEFLRQYLAPPATVAASPTAGR